MNSGEDWSSIDGVDPEGEGFPARAELANAYMDNAELDNAAPLIGALSGQEATVQSLKVQARFSHLQDNTDKAVKLMNRARELAGDKWSDESEAILAGYQSHRTP